MKQIVSGGGGGYIIPTDDEVEVVKILLTLPKILHKSEMIKRFSFVWGLKKKRSVLVSKSEPLSSPEMCKQPEIDADKSPSTTLCCLPSVKCKSPAPVKKDLKRKALDDLMESYNKVQQEREILLRETKAMKTLHQELTSTNLELKAIVQKVKYSRNIESYHPQMTMFAPSTQQLLAMPCSNGGGGGKYMVSRFMGRLIQLDPPVYNQIDPRVKIQEENCSQPLDYQSKYLMMESDLRLRAAAAAARKRRMLRMKENKSALLSIKLSRGCSR
ncbi:hypothetical protein QVD17_32226 [Tagetes erecta]|uniref:Uncharacterized protein n=1 Tax=Tagetes erecta TaxID=13708 RepID=A0AAD8K4U7_TARER|nr:hypothetical protein QVD17_32226 [Tagetes erecta]